MSLAALPGDLLLELAAAIDVRADVRSLAVTSKSVWANVAPALYQKVVLRSAEQTTRTLSMLKQHSSIARHVRELVISPSHSNYMESKANSAAVASIAFSKSLESLARFSWYDDYLHEEMWFALRMCCPRLRYLSTSVGALFPTNSQLFNFVDLRGFSLHLGPGFYENNNEPISLEEGWPPSQRLWDMLFNRCPNLEELEIQGHSVFPAEMHFLVDGRWPHLRRLVLGDLSIDWRTGIIAPGQKTTFISFLEAHPELESLSMSRHNVNPSFLQAMDPDALKLTSFTGTLQQLQGLSHSFSTLKSLTFRDALWSRDPTILAITNVLQQLHALTDLAIVFTLHSPYDSSSILRALIASCSQVQNLTLGCLRQTSFQLDTLAKGLSSFRRMRTLNITLVSAGDLSLAAAGLRFARANPRLRELCIAFVPPSFPHNLPYRPLYPFPRTKKATARFEVIPDVYGLPRTLRVRESTTSVWPWMLRVTRHVRRYTLEVRWNGSGMRGETRQGLLGIFTERSPAGDELRMFALCSVLLCFAGAFLVRG
uniref:F-box domain-containing protein n=1 Tax=Mycena chlorophos TaxID=658473 RepID=A0ABQ0M5A6_MYCCL|nr:predicted protein [Mycena chlorophos]